jgi:hypothetical protein
MECANQSDGCKEEEDDGPKPGRIAFRDTDGGESEYYCKDCIDKASSMAATLCCELDGPISYELSLEHKESNRCIHVNSVLAAAGWMRLFYAAKGKKTLCTVRFQRIDDEPGGKLAQSIDPGDATDLYQFAWEQVTRVTNDTFDLSWMDQSAVHEDGGMIERVLTKVVKAVALMDATVEARDEHYETDAEFVTEIRDSTNLLSDHAKLIYGYVAPCFENNKLLNSIYQKTQEHFEESVRLAETQLKSLSFYEHALNTPCRRQLISRKRQLKPQQDQGPHLHLQSTPESSPKKLKLLSTGSFTTE